MRRIISRLRLSKNEQAVLQAIVNLWFFHRYVSGEIHPGREAIAAKSGLSVRTVASFMAKFRSFGFISPVAYAKGGRNSTRYVVDLDAIRTFGSKPVLVASGPLEAVPLERATDAVSDDKPCKTCTRFLREAPVSKKGPSQKQAKPKGEVVRPTEFSMWRGTARKFFLGWVFGQESLSETQRSMLTCIGESLCPDDGWSTLSNRLLAEKMGVSRRVADRTMKNLIDLQILSVETESRMLRVIRCGPAMSEIWAHAPGMPF